MDSIKQAIRQFRNLDKRQIAMQFLNFLMILTSALMIWKGLSLYTNSESPIVVVLSGSMEPAFHRGDLLFLSMPPNNSINVGDICVYKLPGRDVPIVHRVIKLHDEYNAGKQFILTKGDNNDVDDRGLYNPGQVWIHREDVIGKSFALLMISFLPHVGMVTILMNDYPQAKFVLLGVLGLFVLIHRE